MIVVSLAQIFFKNRVMDRFLWLNHSACCVKYLLFKHLFDLSFTYNGCRFCTTGLPSDIVVEVGEMSFHLHKVTFLFTFVILNSSLFKYSLDFFFFFFILHKSKMSCFDVLLLISLHSACYHVNWNQTSLSLSNCCFLTGITAIWRGIRWCFSLVKCAKVYNFLKEA